MLKKLLMGPKEALFFMNTVFLNPGLEAKSKYISHYIQPNDIHILVPYYKSNAVPLLWVLTN